MKREQPIEDENEEVQKQKAEQEAIESLNVQEDSSDEFNSILMKVFKDMPGTLEEKKKRLINRLQKFFLRESRINVKDGYFCKKREPVYKYCKDMEKEIQLVGTEVILFGIDFAKMKDIVKAYLPEDLKTIDMSHVKLIFLNFDGAMESLRRNMREQVTENGLKLEANQVQPPTGWMEMRPYYINNYERRIIARFATKEEKEIKKTAKTETIIPQYAKKVYDLKKKLSEDIEENCRLREEMYRQRRMERRGKHEEDGQNYRKYNNESGSRRHKHEDNRSQNSASYLIGGKRNNEQEKQDQKRERSRQNDDNKSVTSKRSSLSASSLVNKFSKNLNLQQNEDKESVVSDVSFILDMDQNKDLLQDMAYRLGLIDIGQNQKEEQDSMQLPPLHDNSFSSQRSSNRSHSYSLSQNMPDQLNESVNSYSFTRRGWYDQHNQEFQREQERKKKQEIKIIVIDDD